MTRPLIIGFGNPLREDDGLGWRAAELLEQWEAGKIDVLKCHLLTPELADALSRASLVIFLDASVEQAAGTISIRQVGKETPPAWSHHLSPDQLIRLTQQLTGSAPGAYLVAGGVDRTGWSEAMTAGAERCAAEMADSVRRLLADSVDWCPSRQNGRRVYVQELRAGDV